MTNTKLRLTENQKPLMLRCLKDFYEMHLDLAQDEDTPGFEGEQKFSEECYGFAHSMISQLEKLNRLDLTSSFKCNIANISIDHYIECEMELLDDDYYLNLHKLRKLQDEIQSIWGI